MKRIRLGMIGFGLCSKELHLPALEQLKDKFQLVSVASKNDRSGNETVDEISYAKRCAKYQEILDDPEIQAVVIACPFDLNYIIVKEALQSGKHVFVEKPIAATLKQAKEMAEWGRETSLVTMVAENYRYRETITTAKKYITKGYIGQPKILTYTFFDFLKTNSRWITTSSWRLRSLGGVIADRDIHFVAVMRYLLGEVKSANGNTGCMRTGIGPVDHLMLSALFENNASASLIDCASNLGNNKHEILIIGSRGTIEIDLLSTTLTLTDIEGKRTQLQFPDDKEKSFVAEFEDFYYAIQERSSVRSSFYEGYKDLKLLMAALDHAD